MKSLGVLFLLVVIFGLGYGSGANHKIPDLDALFGAPTATPAPQLALATPRPGSWINDPNRKTTLDAPAHNQTGGPVSTGWAQYYTPPH